MKRCCRGLAGGLLSLSLVSCSAPPAVQGRYEQGLTWIEFGRDGTVRHGGLGDSARFRVEAGERIVISDGPRTTTGRILGRDVIEFPPGDGPLAEAFAGRWVVGVTPGAAPTKAAPALAAQVVLGEWGSPGDPGNLIFKDDGTFRWGATVSGTYLMLEDSRIRMKFVHDGRPSGQMDQRVIVKGDELKLTAPDKSTVVYQRVR